MKKLIVGNWKMNLGQSEITDYLSHLPKQSTTHDLWLAPQFLHLETVKKNAPSWVKVGAQNCSPFNSGAYTGEISPASLKDLGIDFVILGHSERRQLFAEDNRLLATKIRVAIENKLTVIYCVGETLKEREENQQFSVVTKQLTEGLSLASDNLSSVIIAYEPVWAIGTGKVATSDQAQEMHAHIKKVVPQKIKILYGGSVKPDNIQDLLQKPDIDGALVGGASLKYIDMLKLANA